jgi:XTP/dITP diphosphohydrolase
MRVLYACTTNAGKLREFLQAASDVEKFAIEPLPRIREIAPPAETGLSFEENSRLKAIYYSGFADELVFADDSGLEIVALGGAPGVHSARFAGEHATDAENNALALQKLGSAADRRARFVCVISLAHRGRVLHSAQGVVEGEMLNEPAGMNGFGYDPLFFCPALGKTLAEADNFEKFQVSHRGRAFRALLEWLRSQQL